MTKKKGRYSKFIVASVIAMNVIFTVAVLLVFLKTASEPSTLIVSWFTFTTGELYVLSSIKKSKVKKGKGEEDEN